MYYNIYLICILYGTIGKYTLIFNYMHGTIEL